MTEGESGSEGGGAGGRIRRGPFQEGEDVLLISPKQEEHLITLAPGKVFGTHKGNLLHDDLIGKEDGCRAWTAMGDEYRAFRPTYIQFIMNQKRHAQIIYPKDTGPILMWADVFPGATVIEAGIGWGALTIKLLEAVGPAGRVISYEVREDFAVSGAKTVRRYLGECPNHEVKVRDIYQGIDERGVDRIVLDLPEPWQAVSHCEGGAPPRRDPAVLPPLDDPGEAAVRPSRRGGRLRGPRNLRGDPAPLAREGEFRPPGPVDVLALRVPGRNPQNAGRR